MNNDTDQIHLSNDTDLYDRAEAPSPLRHHSDGSISLRAMPSAPLLTLRCDDGASGSLVVLAFGNDIDSASVFAIQRDDAEALVRRLRAALDGPTLGHAC